jgi:hypothetical protein
MSGSIIAQYGVANAGEQHEFGRATCRGSNPPAVLRGDEAIRPAMHHQKWSSNQGQAGQSVEGMTQQGAGWQPAIHRGGQVGDRRVWRIQHDRAHRVFHRHSHSYTRTDALTAKD